MTTPPIVSTPARTDRARPSLLPAPAACIFALFLVGTDSSCAPEPTEVPSRSTSPEVGKAPATPPSALPPGQVAEPEPAPEPDRTEQHRVQTSTPAEDAAPTPTPKDAVDDTKGPADPLEIPATLLPAGCTGVDETDGPWDGTQHFKIGCQAPPHKGWTKVATAENSMAGSAQVTHAYVKDGWMLLYAEQCCTACSDEPGLTDCEPWFTARMYPPADLVDCKKSKACEQLGLCIQEDGWCHGEEEEWGLTF